jgi:DNA-binding MarR family transcriptional regulator
MGSIVTICDNYTKYGGKVKRIGMLDWGLMQGSIGPRIRLLRNLLQARSITISEPYGLPTGSLTIMCLMAANPGSSQSALARWAGITSPSLVGIIDELERRGLVSREKSETDRRRNNMVLTEKGDRTMQALFGEVTEIEASVRNELGPDDMAQLIALLDRAVEALVNAADPA